MVYFDKHGVTLTTYSNENDRTHETGIITYILNLKRDENKGS